MNTQNNNNNNNNECPQCAERMDEIDYLVGLESCIQVQANFYQRERDAALQQVSCLQEQVKELETQRCSMQNLAEAKHINLRLANAEKREMEVQLHLAQVKLKEQAGLSRKARAQAVRKGRPLAFGPYEHQLAGSEPGWTWLV